MFKHIFIRMRKSTIIFLIWTFIFGLNFVNCQIGFYDNKFGPGFGPLNTNNINIDYRNTYNGYNRDINGENFNLLTNVKKPKNGYPSYLHELSDSKCKDILETENFKEKVVVNLDNLKVHGRIAYFCDHPKLSYRESPGYNKQLGKVEEEYRDRTSNTFNSNNPRIQGNVSVFLGIPYANPPTRENGLRFKPPQPPILSRSIDASKYKPACPQARKYTGEAKMIPEIREDCLYLNIFTPFVTNNVKDLYTVMIYIHGGSFSHGSGNTFPGYMLAMTQEVVVVTFNYRLGLFGFLATGDHHSPGNYGLLDQIMLIQWVKDNIRKFNGNPDKIVLFGPGAGAASAGILSVSPLSRHLINKVIAQSGSMMSEWAVQSDYYKIKNNSEVIARTYGCPEFNSENLIRCFNSKSYDIVFDEVINEVGWLPFSPVLDANTRKLEDQLLPDIPEMLFLKNKFNFLTEQPYYYNNKPELNKNLLQNNYYSQYSKNFFEGYLTGVTRDEGVTHILQDEELIKSNFLVTKFTFLKKIKEFSKIFNESYNEKAVLDAIEFMYTPWFDRENESLWRQGLIDMYSDSLYVAGVDKTIKTLLDSNIKTYMYVLNYTIEGLNSPNWFGVPHDSEYLLASGAPFMDYRFYPSELKLNKARWTEADRNMSEFFMRSWANFAKYNNPTPSSLFNTILWTPITKKLEFLTVNSTNYTNMMQEGYRQKQSQFWNDYIHKLIGYKPIVWPPVFEPVQEELRIYRTFTWVILALLVVLIFFTVLCSCLYCRAMSDRVGDANIDFVDLAASGTQYTAPSSKANSEISLNRPNLNTIINGNNKDISFSPNINYGNNSKYKQTHHKLTSNMSSKYARVPAKVI